MNTNRILGLDIIRGVAILLVLFRHGDYPCYVQEIGWIGVDLFFALSGFLVSGLLFKEYLNTGKLRITRFIIRRSLKIFPSFYLFTGVFILFSYFVLNTELSLNSIVHEVLYVQNYFEGLNGHTWSLAVEEQFYIGFALLMFMAFKFRWLNKRMIVISGLLAMIITVVVLRCYGATSNENGFIATHLRIDGILLGVLCSYAIHFTNFKSIISKYAPLILIISGVFLLPILLQWSMSSLEVSFALVAMNIGFALMVLLASDEQNYAGILNVKFINWILKIGAYIGLYSYNIYLWHSLVKTNLNLTSLDGQITVVLYFLLSIGVGVGVSLLVEQPLLRFRNRVFK